MFWVGNVTSTWLTYFSFYNSIGLNPSCMAYYTTWVSSDNKSTSPYIRSVTLPPLFLSLSLKTSCISKLLIRGIVFPDLIWWSLFLIMPLIRSSVSDYCNWLVTTILLFSEVMLSYSHCVEKALVCVIIAVLTKCQPSSYIKCTWVNMWLSCNVWSISDAECVSCISCCCLCLPHFGGGNTWCYVALWACLCVFWSLWFLCLICCRVLCSVCCWEVGKPILFGL